MYRLANSLTTLRNQVDAKFPKRNKASDGWIGDASHQARFSQHNPNEHGVVCAIDITEDLAVGLDCNRLMAELDASNDPRIFYIIHDREIDNSDDSRTPYHGSNPHTRHLHISVKYDNAPLYDDGRQWNLPMLSLTPPKPKAKPRPVTYAPGTRTLRKGDKGSDVKALQTRLKAVYPAYASHLVLDGDFGPATEAVVKEFQRRRFLAVDGVVGPRTWNALGF